MLGKVFWVLETNIAALEIKDILEPLVEKDNRDVNKVTDRLIHKLLDILSCHKLLKMFYHLLLMSL